MIVSNKKYFISSIILLLIIPIIGVQAFAEESTMTDKTNYYVGDRITGFGESERVGELFDYLIYNLDQDIITGGSSFVDLNGNFLFSNNLNLGIGTYEINILGNKIYTNMFDASTPLLNIESDKQQYYNSENINISGTTPADPNISTLLDVKILFSNGTEMTSYNTNIESDGTFTGTIPTTDAIWDNHNGFLILNATIQGYWNTAVIHYTFENDMENETLFNLLIEANAKIITLQNSSEFVQEEIVEVREAIVEVREAIVEVREAIVEVREAIIEFIDDIEEIWIAINELLDLQSPAPQIISLMADDPDDLDNVLSVGDTLGIIFDTKTNTPGGTGKQTESEINDMFAFSGSIGKAYSGKWINSTYFEITLSNISNSNLIISSTTVTPAEITPILPVGNNQENYSYETSPPLAGDWGKAYSIPTWGMK